MSAALSHPFASLDGTLSLGGGFLRDDITMPYFGEAVSGSGRELSHRGASGTSVPEDHVTVLDPDNHGHEPEIHSCPQCDKQFGRLCDLNKHSKSHSRPFKCAFQNCKYSTMGWPTAKELERHVNDKHSPVPRTYSCHFQHCSYKSKRESNCKQHMEKTHGWRYVRSRSNGRRLSRRARSHLTAAQRSTLAQPSHHFLAGTFEPLSHRTQGDFVLFPQDQDASWYDDSHDHDELLTDEDDDRSQGSDVVIPWTSPDTRLRKRETFLQKFSQKFNDPEDETPIDPQLSSVGGAAPAASTDDIHFTSSLVHGNVSSTRADVPIKQEHTLSSTTQNYSSEPFTVALQQRHPASVRAPNHSRNSSAVTVTQSNATASMPHPIHRVAKTAKRKEDGDQDEDHPQKKLKPSPRVGFRDNQMPDIFVAAYPEVYNRDTKSLYQSCETEHRDISTLVRHLSRAPHRLYVSERSIHSFDVDAAELCHARRGVCRRCWVVFTSRDIFDHHVFTECEKVSRGKREKWQVLFDTFTPLASNTSPTGDTPVPGTATHNLPLPAPPGANQSASGRVSVEVDDDDDSPMPSPSPTTIELETRIPLDNGGDGELERLRRENRQLKALVRVFYNNAKGLIELPHLISPDLLEAVVGSDTLAPGAGSRQSGSLTFPVNAGRVGNVNPDRATLVGQMNSHPTDVNRQGMMEDIQQSFSRTSSGLGSSDRSTIRHVSNSPPQRYEAYHGDHSAAPRPRSVHPKGAPTSDRHQPTSLPDSGYGSDKKLNSVGAADMAAEQTKQAGSKSTAGPNNSPQRHAAGQTPGLPVEQVPTEEPSPHPAHRAANTPSDLLPSSGLSPEAFMTRDEEDAYYLSKDIMEQFGDPGYSQPSSSSFQSS